MESNAYYLMDKGDVKFDNKPEVPIDGPEDGSVRQLTLWKSSPDNNYFVTFLKCWVILPAVP